MSGMPTHEDLTRKGALEARWEDHRWYLEFIRKRADAPTNILFYRLLGECRLRAPDDPDEHAMWRERIDVLARAYVAAMNREAS